MGEGTVFSLFVSPHLDRGGGVPRSCLDGGGGGYPSQVWMVGGGVPWSGLDGGGVPQPGLDGGGVPRPGLDGGRYPGNPPARSRWWRGTPWPGLDGGGVPRVPPGQVWMGYPLSQVWMGYPPPTQDSKHLIRGGRYASCVHAGGLSCYYLGLEILLNQYKVFCHFCRCESRTGPIEILVLRLMGAVSGPTLV